jgi:hypothetical protein
MTASEWVQRSGKDSVDGWKKDDDDDDSGGDDDDKR